MPGAVTENDYWRALELFSEARQPELIEAREHLLDYLTENSPILFRRAAMAHLEGLPLESALSLHSVRPDDQALQRLRDYIGASYLYAMSQIQA